MIISFDSNEEHEFNEWLLEAQDNDLIKNIIYQPKSFVLSNRVSCELQKKLKNKTKTIEYFLFHPHKYTADFSFMVISNKISNLFVGTHRLDTNIIYIDIKGSWNRHDGSRSFSINQKWVMEKYNIYVEKIIPNELFKKTWVPKSCRLTLKTKKKIKKYALLKTVEEFLNHDKEDI